MAGTVNDEILRVTGGPTVNDGLLSWFRRGGASVGTAYGDAERQFLCTQLGLALTFPATNNDLWRLYLAAFPGALPDQLLAYWSGNPTPSVVGTLFAAGEQGFYGEPDVPTSIATRVNLGTFSEGTLVQRPGVNVTQAAVSIDGYANSTYFVDNALTRDWFYSFTPFPGRPYTFSCIIQMDDNLPPNPGGAGFDFQLFINGSAVSNINLYTIVDIGGGRFRVSTTQANANQVAVVSGVRKPNTGTARGFRATGFQLEAGPAYTNYQKVTDWTTEYLPLGGNLITCFQDSAGTTPTSAVELPVGRWLDRSGRNNHATQATAGSRPTLSARRNWLLLSTTLATQSVTLAANQYTLSFKDTGTVTLTGASTAGPLVGTGPNDRVSLTFTPTAGSVTFTVTGSVKEAQLEFGPAFTKYQTINTALIYDPVGFPHYLRFDGVDDSMVTPAINFGASDKLSLWDGITKFNLGASTGIVVELGPNVGTSVNAFFHGVADTSPADEIAFRGTAGTTTLNGKFNMTPPATYLISGAIDAAAVTDATRIVIRINGADITETYLGGPPGTGVFRTDVLNLGRRNGATLPFSGYLFALVVRAGASSAAQISSVERYIAGKMQIVIP